MKKLTLICAMLAATLGVFAVPAVAQKSNTLDKMDFGLTYTFKWAKASTTNGPEFLLQGGSLDAAYTPGGKFKGLGLAVDVNGESAQAIEPGVTRKRGHVSGYAETLFGVVHAFDSVFPNASGPQSSATGFASQYGGGLNLQVLKHLGWRVAELDYIYTRLPNNTNTYQSDIRLSAGATYHF
jgi:hypothetical protein